MREPFEHRPRRRYAGALALAALVCLVSTPARAVRADPSPVVLYGDLLLSIFPNQLLPRGYGVTDVSRYPLSALARHHHAIGAVVVNLNASQAGIIYTVFPNMADLLARWRDGIGDHGRAILVNAKAHVTGRQVEGWTMLDGRRVGVTDIIFHDSFVFVSVVTTSTSHRSYGDRENALRLARAGLAQLRILNR